MAQGIYQYSKCQMGKEGTPYTATAATSIWRGMGRTLSDDQTVEKVREMVGVLRTNRDVVTRLFAGLELAETPLTFEQFPYLQAMAFGTSVTGVADGAGAGKIYTSTMPTTSSPTAIPFTWETGDNNEAERAEGCVCTEFTVKIARDATVKMSAKLIGKRVLQNAFTGALSVPTVEDAVSLKTVSYLDAIGGTFGATALTAQVWGATITYKPKWTPIFAIDGNLFYSSVILTDVEISGQITLLHSSAANRASGAKADMVARTAKKLTLDVVGSAISAGTAYSAKHCIFNLPIKYNKASVINESEGLSAIDFDIDSAYDYTAATMGSIITVNTLASLT